MSCVREASPPLQDTDHLRHDIKKRRFLQPLLGLRRIFRRRGRPVTSSSDANVKAIPNNLRSSKDNFESCERKVEATNLEPGKSHSTSHLTDDANDTPQRRVLKSTLLSVSHDSVFTSEQRSPESGSETSLYDHSKLGFPHTSVRAELFEAVRRRRQLENNVSDDEDLGLPRSPVSNSPTGDDIFTKEHMVTKSSHSTCSDGSLLSMGSSEIDDESYYQSSRNSSKLSLYEKRMSSGSDLFSGNERSTNVSLSSDDGMSLSHSAAKHKMAVRPKRNHGVPHKKRQLIASNTLPAMPEVNEENPKVLVSDELATVEDTKHSSNQVLNQNNIGGTLTVEPSPNDIQTVTSSIFESNYSSLPPNVSLSPAQSFKHLTRSKSNASSTQCLIPEDSSDESFQSRDKDAKKEGTSFFSRLLLRRSSKKKRALIEEVDNQKIEEVDIHNVSDEVRGWKVTPNIVEDETSPLIYTVNGLNNAVKDHPLFRNKANPCNLLNTEPITSTRTHTRTYSSVVPVNMDDDVDTKILVKKSHSFRSHEKLPHSCYEGTPSLPVNIGLVEEETVTEMLNRHDQKHYLPTTESIINSFLNRREEVENDTIFDEYDSICRTEEWKPSDDIKIPDYSNISIINCNKVNINVGETKEKNDLKAPVPAPRPSLLNKVTEVNSEKDFTIENAMEHENEINMMVTECSSGRKSIVSIGSIDLIDSESPDNASDSDIESNDQTENDLRFSETELESEKEQSSFQEIQVKKSESNPAVDLPSSQLGNVPSTEEDQEVRKSPKMETPNPVVVTDFSNGIVKVNNTTVIMRKKTRDISQTRDEEPELMKVFARRSLKLKETENIEEMIDNAMKSRDSDKENDDSNSPIEERKKNESRITSEPVKTFNKFQRSISHDVVSNKSNVTVLTANSNEKRQRCKSIPNDIEKLPVKPAIAPRIESTSKKTEMLNENTEENAINTPFKRIQQRREEWEKRAQQQGMKLENNKLS